MYFVFVFIFDRWATRKMNTEFEEMLSTGTGKFLSGIQVKHHKGLDKQFIFITKL